MAIDNIFIDISKMGNYSICPINKPPPEKCMLIRKTNEHTINDFFKKLI